MTLPPRAPGLPAGPPVAWRGSHLRSQDLRLQRAVVTMDSRRRGRTGSCATLAPLGRRDDGDQEVVQTRRRAGAAEGGSPLRRQPAALLAWAPEGEGQ